MIICKSNIYKHSYYVFFRRLTDGVAMCLTIVEPKNRLECIFPEMDIDNSTPKETICFSCMRACIHFYSTQRT